MIQITERDEQLIRKILRFKMVNYEMAREIYKNKWAYYKRIDRLIEEKVLKKVAGKYLTLDTGGIEYAAIELGESFEPLSNPTSKEMVYRWKNIVMVGNRAYIYPHFRTAWELKQQSREGGRKDGISDKNKILGEANGYGIFKVSSKSNMKVLSEMISDMDELVNYGIERFIFLCEGQEKLKDFLDVILKHGTKIRAKALHALPLNESGMRIMDVIVGIAGWKQKVAGKVYSSTFPSRHRVFDFEAGGRYVYIGIDGDMIGKKAVEDVLKAGMRQAVEVLILKGQGWRYEGLPVVLRTITMQEFLSAVGYIEQPSSDEQTQIQNEVMEQ
ncbi:hypothetical protein [Anaerocellum danielii]|uniref:Uncharacterized protein n=1 Tax=Anaerocellum danielii TaxID=1387557 RepID=A0ABZ0TXN4_9FIRM|nr:hypothetical protein [Caldicellulosiruptor danielii]WPX08211.1 hypothetical protein SOJ16_002078 [Caldicellulosiruptor danielii]